MAANTHLPVIGTLDIREGGGAAPKGGPGDQRTAAKNKQNKTAASFLSRLQLGSLQQFPQPGDVYRGSATSRHPRPLGLLPNHNDRLAALKELNKLLSPWMVGHRAPPPPPPSPPGHKLNTTWPPATSEDTVADPISATVHLRHESTPAHKPEPKLMVTTTSLSDGMKDATAYRLSHKGLSDAAPLTGNRDPDYMGDKAREYYALIGMAPLPTPKPSLQQGLLQFDTSTSTNQKGEKKKAKLKRYDHVPVSNVHYMNFTGQAQLFERSFLEDKRTALDYEPCERCRLRGTRCSQCKAIRTGGGYIILDGGNNPDMRGRRRKGFDFKWSGGVSSGGEGGVRGGGMKGEGLVGLDGDRRGLGGGEGEYGGEGSARRSGGGGGGGWGGEEGRGGGWHGSGGGGDVADGMSGQDTGRGAASSGTQPQRHGKTKDDGGEGGDVSMRRLSTNVRQDSGAGVGGEGVGEGDGTDRGGDHSDIWEESGRQSHGSRSASRAGRLSRPGSMLGSRPGSSLRGAGRGTERGRRSRGPGDMEGGHGRGHRARGRTGEDGDDTDGDGGGGKGGKRRGRKSSALDREDRSREYQGSEYNYKRDNEEEEEREGYRGNLMKFKRKRDDVKALHATLKELQGIDPLDYLAKYCIIDQTKLPHYQHVFNNVDRDEDDEIDIGELDFALKAVNYDLISDAEMNYVHSVLELTGRYSLNFRLFSLIAALSEKVVALEDMVKRLINKMDFDALEVKMKKCKELFYLLADSDAAIEHEGGVVTTGSLAVELQAGGLTQEHVEFVVDRLNHEGKGLVEFLDYLTYVPLFVEIHDAIYGNPLDFSRTR